MKSPTRNLELRGAEPTGNGWYGAKRGSKKHKGLDIKAKEGEPILSPISGVFVRTGTVYTFTRRFQLAVVANEEYEVKIMYLTPQAGLVGRAIREGDVIGYSQDVARYWGGGMINHIHVEVRKYGLLTDPEPLLIPKCP